jgi:hypothetical protein
VWGVFEYTVASEGKRNLKWYEEWIFRTSRFTPTTGSEVHQDCMVPTCEELAKSVVERMAIASRVNIFKIVVPSMDDEDLYENDEDELSEYTEIFQQLDKKSSLDARRKIELLTELRRLRELDETIALEDIE